MQPLVSPHEMAVADKRAISAGTPAEELMDRAGRAIARAAIAVAGGRYGKTALVVCGPGNNGGDGFVAARRLSQEGLKVTCVSVAGTKDVFEEAAHHRDQLRRAGISIRSFDPSTLPSHFDVVVDALLGTGSRGAPRDNIAAAIAFMNGAGPVVAADIPSGVDGATGAIPGEAVTAHVTVAIERQKWGTALSPGAGRAGQVFVAPIGIALGDSKEHLLEAADVALSLPKRTFTSHKGSAGSVALLAGSPQMAGAAVLAARGVDRAGAGYVRVGTVTSARRVIAERLPEVLLSDLGEDWDASSWDKFEHELQRSGALILGPGLGGSDAARALVESSFQRTDLPILVDADGLNAIVGSDELVRKRSAPVVMTPHIGEMARLLEIENEEVMGDTLGAARRAAERYGCVVLLKGPRTVVAEEDRAVINPFGSPALATAGSGDVLSGAIGAMLAAGLEPFEAAWTGAAIHGRAGELCAEARGELGVVAWDIAEALPLAVSSFALP